jgi:hypothetical protein
MRIVNHKDGNGSGARKACACRKGGVAMPGHVHQHDHRSDRTEHEVGRHFQLMTDDRLGR